MTHDEERHEESKMWSHGSRNVRVAESQGMWLTWTDKREIEWFHTRHEAIQWALIWAYLHRPAKAELVTLFDGVQKLSDYPAVPPPAQQHAPTCTSTSTPRRVISFDNR